MRVDYVPYIKQTYLIRVKQSYSFMQKFPLISLSLFLFLQGCCAFTSADCFCDPPAPDLSPLVRDWINPFDDVAFLVYADSSGNTDTLDIERTQGSEWTGGEECGTDGHVENAILTRRADNTQLITVKATRSNIVTINQEEDQEVYIWTNLNTPENELVAFGEHNSGTFSANYDWKGTSLTAFEVSCSGSPDCDKLIMPSLVLSKERGLLQYTDMQGTIWELME